ncbi:MAG: hypothetical protein ABIG84_00620 [archaeon]
MTDESIRCRNCGRKNIIKRGKRKTKYGNRQLYWCKSCSRYFVDSSLNNKTYGPKVIANAMNMYNQGNTLEDSARHTNRKYKVKISKSSVHDWLKEYSGIFTYNRIRPKALKTYGKDIIFAKTYEHNGLDYDFRYHIPKVEFLCTDTFPGLKSYVTGFENSCPKFFNDIDNRCSQMKIDISFRKQGKYNNACRLANFALKTCRNNRERHPTVENMMLINDSSTIACEVPIWLWEKNLNAGINGHIDVLQVRNGLVYILDFKPDAFKEKAEKVASQLFFYASGLSFRTGIKLDKFRCAWFDETVYYEFDPSSAKVRFPKPYETADYKLLIPEGKAADFVSEVRYTFRKN